MNRITIEMKYCRRCGAALKQQAETTHVYTCNQGHTIYCNASPAMGVALLNDNNEVLVLERAIEPGKGMLDIPGGFCDGAETLEHATARELQEEVNILPDQYDALKFICSGIDAYDFGGEVLPVLGVMFSARLKGNAHPKAASDAMSARFMKLQDINMDKVYFPSVRLALETLRTQLT